MQPTVAFPMLLQQVYVLEGHDYNVNLQPLHQQIPMQECQIKLKSQACTPETTAHYCKEIQYYMKRSHAQDNPL